MRRASSIRLLAVAVAALTAVGVSGCGGSSSAGQQGGSSSAAGSSSEPLQVKVGEIGQDITFEMQAVALHAGFFKKQGLEVKQFTTQSGVTATKAVAAGQLDVAVAGGSETLAAIAKGANIKILAPDVNTFPYYLVAKKGITSVSQLKGGSVAVSHVGASSYYGAITALSHLGLKKSDYHVQLVGGQTARLASVSRGAVDATVIGPQLVQKAKSAGLTVLADLAQQKILYSQDYVVASGSFISKHPDFVKKYRTALKQARQFLFDPAKKTQVIQAISAVFKAGPNSSVVKSAYEYVQQHKSEGVIFPKGLPLSKSVFKHTLSIAGIKGNIKLSEIAASGVPITA